MEKFENFIRVESIHQIIQNREDGKRIHHADSHLEISWNFRNHVQLLMHPLRRRNPLFSAF
ncbi:hypothetical protein [Methanosarcina horonobensis]|uniref:hypothetical protein n=1 Tax=Methanosarcina horonobensis TaxID=418008 RepID=UPI0022B86AEB|nr:hypothetical protein [Methanosarcina horonobensis]